jgi:hypothetical protein
LVCSTGATGSNVFGNPAPGSLARHLVRANASSGQATASGSQTRREVLQSRTVRQEHVSKKDSPFL